MVFRAAFFLLPLAAFAQTAPPEVDQALRARVNEFFQYHVDGTFRKAESLVAEDTKDYYFSAQKLQFKTFKIDSIQYSDHFTKATVTLTAERMMRMRIDFPEQQVTVPMSTTWKIENGKWVWYNDPHAAWLTPMGPSDMDAIKKKPEGADPAKPNLSASALADRAKSILQQSELDKTEVKFTANKASSDQVVFHNGQPGMVRVFLMPNSDMPAGLTAKLDKSDVNGGENATLKISYEPKADAPAPKEVSLRLMMEPFSRVFVIPVRFEGAN